MSPHNMSPHSNSSSERDDVLFPTDIQSPKNIYQDDVEVPAWLVPSRGGGWDSIFYIDHEKNMQGLKPIPELEGCCSWRIDADDKSGNGNDDDDDEIVALSIRSAPQLRPHPRQLRFVNNTVDNYDALSSPTRDTAIPGPKVNVMAAVCAATINHKKRCLSLDPQTPPRKRCKSNSHQVDLVNDQAVETQQRFL